MAECRLHRGARPQWRPDLPRGKGEGGLSAGLGLRYKSRRGAEPAQSSASPRRPRHRAPHRDLRLGPHCLSILVRPVPHHAGVLGWGRYRRSRARCPPFSGVFLPQCLSCLLRLGLCTQQGSAWGIGAGRTHCWGALPSPSPAAASLMCCRFWGCVVLEHVLPEPGRDAMPRLRASSCGPCWGCVLMGGTLPLAHPLGCRGRGSLAVLKQPLDCFLASAVMATPDGNRLVQRG